MISVIFYFCVFSAAVALPPIQEVVQPAEIPANARYCAQLLVRAEPLGTSLIQADYDPPKNCGESWAKVMLVLEGAAAETPEKNNNSSTELRVGGVWLDAVQILTTSTPAATRAGVEWTLKGDVTTYARLFKSRSRITALFSSISGDQSHLSHFNVSIFVVFYKNSGGPAMHRASPRSARARVDDLFEPPLVIPLAAPLSNLTGHWLVIGSANESSSALATLPNNTVGAYLDVIVSPQGEEEFWYENPDEFREVTITLDDKLLLDAIWPFPLVYNRDRYWESVASMGTFSWHTYFVSLKPFLSLLADGRSHKLSFQVVNAKKSWFLGANLIVETDSRISKIPQGGLISYQAPPVIVSRKSNSTVASRTISSVGFVVLQGMNFTTSVEHWMVHKITGSLGEGNSLKRMTTSELTYKEQDLSAGVYDDWSDRSLSSLLKGELQLDQSLVHRFESSWRWGTAPR